LEAKEADTVKNLDTSLESGTQDPSLWVDLHGDALYRFALLRVEDQHVAEDLVQETFLAALKALDRFEGGSSVRTWLTGILKHKIVDYFRRSAREIASSDVNSSNNEAEMDLFDHRGRWKDPPRDWNITPSEVLEDKEFWQTFQSCLDGLTPVLRHAFTMKEVDGMNSEEICKVLDISATNLWVVLHRSRGKLRKCLEVNWFEEKKGQGN
jgi:RNA polymerase sigma-70 factor (ECF subfamily)